jgi:cytidine deaminase
MNETNQDIRIITPTASKLLSDLLPNAFGPKDLGIEGGLLADSDINFKSDHTHLLTAQAIEAAHRSYSPYTNHLGGVAIKMKDGRVVTGCYLENAAFNPSLAAILPALAILKSNKMDYKDICEVVCVESPASEDKPHHAEFTASLVKHIAPEAAYTLEILN